MLSVRRRYTFYNIMRFLVQVIDPVAPIKPPLAISRPVRSFQVQKILDDSYNFIYALRTCLGVLKQLRTEDLEP